jgi:glycosyltransferase involved in cell wall biosynthesis
MGKNKQTVAIVIPTFNRSEFVQKAIDSALSQTYPCEVIVCDHGSKDNTPEVMKKYGNKITYIRKEEDFGPHFCWLDGIIHAKSEFVHLQFDDDWIDKKYVEKCIELMKPEVGVVIADAWGMFKFKKIFGKTGIFSSRKLEKRLLSGAMYSPGASLFRKKDLIDALYLGDLPMFSGKGYHGVGPDSFFTLLTILRYKKVGIVTEPLVFFREHEGSITLNAHKDPERYARLRNAYENVISYYLFLKWYSFFNKLKYFSPRFWLRTLFVQGRIILKRIGLFNIAKKQYFLLIKTKERYIKN